MCVYVREISHGLLPGFANLYCLDGNLGLMWMAEWPESYGPCTRIVDISGDTLIAESASGATVRLDAHSGRLSQVVHPMAAAG